MVDRYHGGDPFKDRHGVFVAYTDYAALREQLEKAGRAINDPAEIEAANIRADLAVARATSAESSLSAANERIAKLEAELAWYGEQARLARLIHSEGDKGRHALADDGGKRARALLASKPGGAE